MCFSFDASHRLSYIIYYWIKYRWQGIATAGSTGYFTRKYHYEQT